MHGGRALAAFDPLTLLALLLFNGLVTEGSSLTPFSVVQGHLALAQRIFAIANLGTHTAEAILDGKVLIADGLFLDFAPLKGTALFLDALTLDTPFCLGRLQGTLGSSFINHRLSLGDAKQEAACSQKGSHGTAIGQKLHAKSSHRAACAQHQVSPVSTTRRSKARNSLDCISLSRDTVRGNSCAKGPSV
ncbi:Secreted protein [Paracidovorax anthurii]|uniref:Uncharacterized protein n=1 Tax=Paracidovorax anthurii TaxID=78229 RepID=A0A328ZT41_9BURK|nr:hypothetical protein AX018_100577 [Paracidovorax anthurii]